jgi:hypothetical protein
MDVSLGVCYSVEDLGENVDVVEEPVEKETSSGDHVSYQSELVCVVHALKDDGDALNFKHTLEKSIQTPSVIELSVNV